MIEHSEFPWGPESVPGLLTPLGAFGWLAAALLALALIALMRGPVRDKGKEKDPGKELAETYEMILAAARHALSMDDYGLLGGAADLRRVIRTRLGGVMELAGGIGKLLKAIGEAMGEDQKPKEKGKDKKKDKDKHKHDGKPQHDAVIHHVVHGGYPAAASAAAASGRTAALAAAGNNVHGPSITVNVGVAERPAGEGHGEVAAAATGHEPPPHGPVPPHAPGHGHGHPPGQGPGHGDGHGHDDHGHHDHDDEHEEKPLTFAEQLAKVREAVRDFEVWWSDRGARMDELRRAHRNLTHPEPLDDRIHGQIKYLLPKDFPAHRHRQGRE
jgi:hypothetical protein